MATLKGYMITGIATVVPLVVTFYILWYLIQFIDGISQPIVVVVLHRDIPGLGLLITIAILILVGIFVSYTVGKKAAELLDKIMLRIPLSRSIYGIIKNISDTFLTDNKAFGNVVLVKFMPEVFILGFVGGRSPPEIEAATSMKLTNVFVPTSPNPATGVVFLVSQDRIMPAGINPDKAMGIILSAGFMGEESSKDKTQ
jgi:uncharacterized membrane protein